MLRTAIFYIALSGVPIFSNSNAEAFQCDVCHSKNPAMVKMHKATQEKKIGCFECHRVGDKLMGKGRHNDVSDLLHRRSTEPVCVQCHLTEGAKGSLSLPPAKL
jgi:polyferredoxin